MAKPENRWQLLLVSDDGRIIPFKRIKGIAVTLVVLLVILGLVCAGLGWQVTAEKIRHRHTLDQLNDAKRQVVHYKSEHELISAELVLAEARMEKAGLTVQRRQQQVEQPTPAKPVDAQPVPEPKIDGGDEEPETIAAVQPPAANQPSDPAAPAPPAGTAKKPVSEAPPAKDTDKPIQPAVAMDDLEIKYDAGKKLLLARFRVKNAGPRSSPVAGRCVVVLKTDQADPGQWLSMPRVTLVNGEPDGVRGQAFKISHYKDMEIKAMGQTDPSIFKSATVYVFASSGAKILDKEFPIDLPAPKPESKPIVSPAAQPDDGSETTPEPVPPQTLAPTALPADRPAPAIDAGEAAANPPPAAAPESVPETGPPTDDPTLSEGIEPVKREDSRSRF